jgi:hypothetical protein
MNKNKMSLEDLFELRGTLLNEGLNVDKLSELILLEEEFYVNSILEDGPGGAAAAASIGVGGGGVGYANASIGGMGSVVSAQPSAYAGSTSGSSFTAGGGTVGSGDISVPYNPGGKKKVFQKLPAPLSDRRGTNKRRKNKILRGLKNIFSQKQDYTSNQGSVQKSKVMSFDQFDKEKLSQVTKVKQ